MVNAQVRSTAPETEFDDDGWLSALLDGELEGEEAVRSIEILGRDASMARRWHEYNLIGDAMRGCAMDNGALNKRIMAALAAEPTVLAPVPKSNRQPVYWAAAAAAVVAITWSVLSVAPSAPGGNNAPVAANNPSPAAVAASQEMASNDVSPYMAAHQDYAFAVAGEPDIHFTPVSYNNEGGQ